MPKKPINRDEAAAAIAAKEYIDDHPGTGISTAALANMNNLSRNVLQKAFKKKYNKPIGQYKLQKRMEEGRRLLKSGSSMKEVSFKLNYASPSSFSNAFRNHYKISPLEWYYKYKHNATKQG